MLEGIEFVSNLITRSAIFESLYLQAVSPATDQVAKSVVNLYAAMLRYLSCAKRYYVRNTGSKILQLQDIVFEV